jgi:hypothetical protein
MQPRLQDAVNRLPGTAVQIAATFNELGIAGRQTSPWACPVAQYLATELGLRPGAIDGTHVSTGTSSATVVDGVDAVAHVFFPGHVREFVARFDRGDYPGLVEHEGLAAVTA